MRQRQFVWALATSCALIWYGCADGGDAPRRDGGPRDAAAIDSGVMLPDAGPPRIDAGTDAGGPVDLVPLCGTCNIDAQCGTVARCGPLSGGERVCLRLCNPEFHDCPRGFECAAYAPLDFQNVCLPVGSACCIDEDADGYGVGGSCLGADCDDADVDRHPDAAELCDGADQDCDDVVDEAFTDCQPQRCVAVGGGTFEERGEAACTEGACVDPAPTSCGLYTCEGGGDTGDFCARACARDGEPEDDTRCIASAHCDGTACEADYPNGAVCDEDSDCISGNCENGYCCGAGQVCCAADSDCPGYPGEGTVCGEPDRCQGTRGTVTCNPTTFACETISGTPDDTACDSGVLANACGPFRDLHCTGETSQTPPSCPSSCTSDEGCDDAAHCEDLGGSGYCYPDLPDGERCDEASDCVSGHCQNGFCCAGGDCCASASDCPAGYGTPPVCDDARACQGTRDAPVCVNSQCGTMLDFPDDSACTTGVVADACGLYPTVRCTGALDQRAPECATACSGDSECDENAHCDDGVCVLDQPAGTACDEASDCVSGYCANGFCCAGGDCCARASDCPASYSRASECNSPSTCQGTRRDAVCTATFSCQLGEPTPDDTGCAGMVSNTCGLFPSVSCTSAADQPSDQASLCDVECVADAECDPGAFCNPMGTCQSQGLPGDSCSLSSQCQSGLSCVDGVCCNSACNGLCEACNVPGSLGTCAPVPSGTDPAAECGGFDCSSHFAGWSGDVCRERAPASDAAVMCNGMRACQTPAQVCGSQPPGDARVTCDDTCQDPRAGTCTGTTPPVCDNVSAGNVSCGTGACFRTVPRGVSGADNVCIPGPSSAETCNDIDDDCDGVADNNIPGLTAYEPNNSGGQARALTTVTTDGASGSRSASATAQLYYDGDVDYYSIRVEEDGAADCLDCLPRTSEHSTLTVRLHVPVGAGSYRMCYASSPTGTYGNCITVTGGTSGLTTFHGPSAGCVFSTNNSHTFYVRIEGVGAPRWECQPYRLEYTADEACG